MSQNTSNKGKLIFYSYIAIPTPLKNHKNIKISPNFPQKYVLLGFVL